MLMPEHLIKTNETQDAIEYIDKLSALGYKIFWSIGFNKNYGCRCVEIEVCYADKHAVQIIPLELSATCCTRICGHDVIYVVDALVERINSVANDNYRYEVVLDIKGENE